MNLKSVVLPANDDSNTDHNQQSHIARALCWHYTVITSYKSGLSFLGMCMCRRAKKYPQSKKAPP